MIKLNKIGIWISLPLLLVLIFVLVYVLKNHGEKAEQRLRIIAEESIWGMVSEKDTVYGFNYEIARKLADRSNLELEMSLDNDIEKCLEELDLAKVDVVAAFIPASKEIVDKYYVTAPFFNSRLVLVQNMDSVNEPVNDQNQLIGKKISIPANALWRSRLSNLSEEIAGEILVEELKDLSQDSLISLTAGGNCAKTVCPEFLTAYYHSKFKDLDFSLPLGFNQDYVWICRKDDQKTIKLVNDFMDSFVFSSDFIHIKRKYLNK